MADNTEGDPPVDDVEMAGADDEAAEGADGDGAEETGLTQIEPETTLRETFLDYLRSPIIQIAVASEDESTVLSAHEALLVKAPYFAEQCAQFGDTATNRRIDLPDEDLSAVGSVLEYLYNGDYFPRRLGEGKDAVLEADPSMPSPDTTGVALLRHAKVYTLAEKLGMPALKSLAHTKIHRTASTARGEIAYARYVYQKTSKEDATIRKPVAAFWATRSHVLRHEADDEFRAMCLEFPQFAFDVLSLVLDHKEKREGSHGPVVQAGERTGRKRPRHSQG